MKRIPTEADLELKEVKEAIQTLGEYCESRGSCNNCDREIMKWCDKYIAPCPVALCPSDWQVE